MNLIHAVVWEADALIGYLVLWKVICVILDGIIESLAITARLRNKKIDVLS